MAVVLAVVLVAPVAGAEEGASARSQVSGSWVLRKVKGLATSWEWVEESPMGRVMSVVMLRDDIRPGEVVLTGGSLNFNGDLMEVVEVTYLGTDDVGLTFEVKRMRATDRMQAHYRSERDAQTFREHARVVGLINMTAAFSSDIERLKGQQIRTPTPPTTLEADVGPPMRLHLSLEGTQLRIGVLSQKRVAGRREGEATEGG